METECCGVCRRPRAHCAGSCCGAAGYVGVETPSGAWVPSGYVRAGSASPAPIPAAELSRFMICVVHAMELASAGQPGDGLQDLLAGEAEAAAARARGESWGAEMAGRYACVLDQYRRAWDSVH